MPWLLLLLLLPLLSFDPTQATFKGPPDVSAGYLERYVAQVGDTVKLICPIIGTPRPLIEWYQDEQLIQYSSRERFRRGKRYLKIKGVQVVDSGVYVCKGVNGFGSRSVDLNLVVKDPKDLIPKKFSIPNLPTVVEDIKTSTNEAGGAVRVGNFGPILIQKTPVMGDAIYHESGDTLRLECLVDGSPVPTITWYKDEDILLAPNLQTLRTQTTLVIPNLDEVEDVGVYKCKARNAYGEVEASFPVRVEGKGEAPKILGPLRSNRTLLEPADTLHLNCEVISSGKTQVMWLRQLHDYEETNNETITVFNTKFEVLPVSKMQTGHSGFYNATLRIHYPSHVPVAGRYICMAYNPDGHAQKEVFVGMSHDGQDRQDDVKASDPVTTNMRLSDRIPLILVVTVPIISLTLLVMLICAVCCCRRRRDMDMKPEEKGVEVNPRPAIHVNPMASPYASSFVATTTDTKSCLSANWMASYRQQMQSPFQTPSKSPQWRSLAATEESNYYMEVGTATSSTMAPNDPDPDVEQWVEVTNKANQTPSHWVYSDMVSGLQRNKGIETTLMDYALPRDDSAVHSASTSLTNSPLLRKGHRLMQTPLLNPASSSPALTCSTQLTSPSYASTQNLYQNTTARTPGPPAALGLGLSPLTARVFQKSVSGFGKEPKGRPGKGGSFKSMEDADSGRGSRLSSTDHVYFKISERFA